MWNSQLHWILSQLIRWLQNKRMHFWKARSRITSLWFVCRWHHLHMLVIFKFRANRKCHLSGANFAFKKPTGLNSDLPVFKYLVKNLGGGRDLEGGSELASRIQVLSSPPRLLQKKKRKDGGFLKLSHSMNIFDLTSDHLSLFTKHEYS